MGLSTGALYNLRPSGNDCSNVEEVPSYPSPLTRQASADWTDKAW